MSGQKPRIGFHLGMPPKSEGGMSRWDVAAHIRRAARECRDAGAHLGALQIFVAGPADFTFPEHFKKPEYQLDVLKACTEHDIELYIHGTYRDNPWRGSPDWIEKIRAHIAEEGAVGAAMGARGLILHIPSVGRKTLFWALEKIRCRIPIILETSASCFCKDEDALELDKYPADRSDILEGVRKLNEILLWIHRHSERSAGTEKWCRFEVCIDTAHLWSSGINIRYAERAADYISTLIHPEYIKLLHLNENTRDLGSCADEHAPLVRARGETEDKGIIWRGIKFENSGLSTFLHWAKESEKTIMLERRSYIGSLDGISSTEFANTLQEMKWTWAKLNASKST